MSEINSSRHGNVTFKEPETADCVPGTWHPPDRLLDNVPEGFCISLKCITRPDGLKYIEFNCCLEVLVDFGAAGGSAILHDTHGWNKHTRASYRIMHFLHQRVRGRDYRETHGMQEHLARPFKDLDDLYVLRLARLAADECDVLPDGIGQDSRGEGKRLSVGDFISRRL